MSIAQLWAVRKSTKSIDGFYKELREEYRHFKRENESFDSFIKRRINEEN